MHFITTTVVAIAVVESWAESSNVIVVYATRDVVNATAARELHLGLFWRLAVSSHHWLLPKEQQVLYRLSLPLRQWYRWNCQWYRWNGQWFNETVNKNCWVGTYLTQSVCGDAAREYYTLVQLPLILSQRVFYLLLYHPLTLSFHPINRRAYPRQHKTTSRAK